MIEVCDSETIAAGIGRVPEDDAGLPERRLYTYKSLAA